MNHNDHVRLISEGIQDRNGTWADLGSGEGAFTLALADVSNQQAQIFSVDKNKRSLQTQKELFSLHFPETKINFLQQNFTDEINFPKLDGILMANSLHYIKDKKTFLINLKKYLKPEGRLILVEYNVDKGNYWVPYPLSFETFKVLAEETGFSDTRKIGSIPSAFLDEIYSAVTFL